MPAKSQGRPESGLLGNRTAQEKEFGHHASWLNNVIAAGQGFQDGMTFGLGDQAVAGLRGLYKAAHQKSLSDAIGAFRKTYRQAIDYEHARDQYYAEHNGGARTVGTVATLFVPGGGVRAVAKGIGKLPAAARLGEKAVAALGRWGAPATKVAQRIPEVTRLSGREKLAIGGAGAVGGVASQAAVDLALGRRSSWQDYVGAAAGGMAQSMAALKGNPKLAAAVGGATSSVTDDALRGKMPSVDGAAKSAYASMLPAAIAHKAVTRIFDRLPTTTKQKTGELGSIIRTRLNGDRTVATAQIAENRVYLDPNNQIGKRVARPYTQPDQLTAMDNVIESKFGYKARLRDRQQQARRELGPRYRVDHFLPDDVGSLAGFVVSQPAHSATDGKPWWLDTSALPELRPAVHPALWAPGIPAYIG